jgi:uncharacterized membrane protein
LLYLLSPFSFQNLQRATGLVFWWKPGDVFDAMLTADGHFTFTKGMSMMIPAYVPLKMQLIYLTGILEVVLGILVLFPSLRAYRGYLLILFFVLITPANVLAALK